MLLDTQLLLWVLANDRRLGHGTRAALRAAPRVQYSSISIAEIRNKQMLGKLQVPDDLLDRIASSGISGTLFSAGAADRLQEWQTLVRQDPFDRLLLSAAADLGTRLVTVDPVLLALDGAPVVDARQ